MFPIEEVQMAGLAIGGIERNSRELEWSPHNWMQGTTALKCLVRLVHSVVAAVLINLVAAELARQDEKGREGFLILRPSSSS
ncbi:hypothetical protein ACSQ67_011400 [Phaseolus vulgaris]